MIKVVVPTVLELPSYEEIFRVKSEFVIYHIKVFGSKENHHLDFYWAKDLCIYDLTAGKFLFEKPMNKDNYEEAIRMIIQLSGGTIK